MGIADGAQIPRDWLFLMSLEEELSVLAEVQYVSSLDLPFRIRSVSYCVQSVVDVKSASSSHAPTTLPHCTDVYANVQGSSFLVHNEDGDEVLRREVHRLDDAHPVYCICLDSRK